MPTYEYQCTKCENNFEIVQKITDDPISVCEKCGGRIRKIMFPVGIVFKGSGFHINDYRKPDKSAPSSTPTETSSSKS